MLTKNDLDRIQKRLELWNRPGNPISVNTGLELVTLARKGLEAEKLEKEADWLAARLNEFCHTDTDQPCCKLKVTSCKEATVKMWREAAHKAVEGV